MNIPKIIEAIGGIDDKYLKEAELPEKRRFRFKPTLLAAIIVIVALSTGAAALNYTRFLAAASILRFPLRQINILLRTERNLLRMPAIQP